MSVSGATTWARWAAAVVFLLAFVAVVVPGVRHLDLGDPYKPRVVVTKKVTTENGETTVERTTAEADDPLVERALGGGGLLLARLTVACFAAFLAGALVQRTLLGKFGFKAAGVEVPELEEAAAASEAAIADLTRELARQRQLTRKALVAAASVMRRVDHLEHANQPKATGQQCEHQED